MILWLKKGISLFDNGNKMIYGTKNLNSWQVSHILDYLLTAYILLKNHQRVQSHSSFLY